MKQQRSPIINTDLYAQSEDDKESPALYGIDSDSASLGWDIMLYKSFHGAGYLERKAVNNGNNDKDDYLRCAFERDYWAGLFEAGEKTREEAGTAAALWHTENIEKGLQLDDLQLKAMEYTRGDEAQWEKQLLGLLKPNNLEYKKNQNRQHIEIHPLFVLNDVKNLTRLSYIGGVRFFDYFVGLIQRPDYQKASQMLLRRGRHLCRFDLLVRETNLFTTEFFNSLICGIVGTVLTSGRPLRAYSCTFHFPLQICPKQIKNASPVLIDPNIPLKFEDIPGDTYQQHNEKAANTQALRFFSPLLRKRLFSLSSDDTGGKKSSTPQPNSIQSFRFNKHLGKKLTLAIVPNKDESRVTAHIDEIVIHCHPLGQAILSIRVSLPPDNYSEPSSSIQSPEKADTNEWWKDLFSSETNVRQQISSGQLENWLKFTQRARILYPTFSAQQFEKKINEVELKSGENNIELTGNKFSQDGFNQFISYLVHQLTGEPISHATRESLRSDRMFVSAAYALSGPPPSNPTSEAEFERIFQIGLNVDRQQDAGTGRAVYAEEFNQSAICPKIYRRWQHLGTLFGFTDHSHVCMAFGRVARDKIVTLDVPYIYNRMTLLNLFYKHTLDHIQIQFGEDQQQTSKLRKKFSDFTNRHWFHNITEQQQGKDIYTLQSQAMGLKSLYVQLQTEINTEDQIQNEKRQNAQKKAYQEQAERRELERKEDSEKSKRIASISSQFGAIFTLVTLIVTLLTVPLINKQITSPFAKWLLTDAKQMVCPPCPIELNPSEPTYQTTTTNKPPPKIKHQERLAYWLELSLSLLISVIVLVAVLNMLSIAAMTFQCSVRNPIFQFAACLLVLPMIFLLLAICAEKLGIDYDFASGILNLSYLLLAISLLIRFRELFMSTWENPANITKNQRD